MYNDRVMDHFLHPRNVGTIEDADGVGSVGNVVCGDTMKVYIRVRHGRIADIRYRTFGCAAAIATGSIMTEMVRGETLDEALELSDEEVAAALDGLPEGKMHCSNMAAEGLRSAIEDYRSRNDG